MAKAVVAVAAVARGRGRSGEEEACERKGETGEVREREEESGAMSESDQGRWLVAALLVTGEERQVAVRRASRRRRCRKRDEPGRGCIVVRKLEGSFVNKT